MEDRDIDAEQYSKEREIDRLESYLHPAEGY